MYFSYTYCFLFVLLILLFFYFICSLNYIVMIKPRFGYFEILTLRQSIWVHAVSVGEVKAVQKLCDCLRKRYPNQPLVLSTTTPTGQQLARDTQGLADYVFYFPFDLP